MRLTIIYNNEAKKGFKSGWGFSCLIESDNKKILFDTGDRADNILFNMKKLGISPNEISIVIISHDHHDHKGGLDGFLKENKRARVILPASFSEPTEITESVYSTGPLKSLISPKEQSVFVKTKKGLVVIVGCSHPGLDNILDVVRKHGNVYAVIGGFHGFNKFDALNGISVIGACHCTKHIDEIKALFLKQFREIKAGDLIEI